MSVVGTIKSEIINTISSAIPNVRVADEFNEQDLHSIGNKPVVCVYIKSMESKSIAFGDLLSFGYDGNKTYTKNGKQMSAVVGLSIYVHKCNGKADTLCENLFEQIVELMMLECSLSASSISRGEITFKQSYQAYTLSAELLINDVFTKNDKGNSLSDFRLAVKAINGGDNQ